MRGEVPPKGAEGSWAPVPLPMTPPALRATSPAIAGEEHEARSVSMEKRKLGRSSLEFAPIAFGGNVFGWTADEATSHKILDAFVDAGFSFIDTADVYSRWKPGNKGGESETVIGSWLKKSPAKRDKVLIATKCGMDMPNVGQ